MLMYFNAVNKIATCGVVVISNLTMCNICVYHTAVFGDIKISCDAGISFLAFLKQFHLKLTDFR